MYIVQQIILYMNLTGLVYEVRGGIKPVLYKHRTYIEYYSKCWDFSLVYYNKFIVCYDKKHARIQARTQGSQKGGSTSKCRRAGLRNWSACVLLSDCIELSATLYNEWL